LQIYKRFSNNPCFTWIFAYLSFPELCGSHVGEAFEVFGEEGGIGEVHLLGNLGDGLVGMSQLHLDAGDEGKVNPLFCRRTTCLADDGAEVTLRQTHLIGIETNLVLLDGMLVDKIDEAVEDALFP